MNKRLLQTLSVAPFAIALLIAPADADVISHGETNVHMNFVAVANKGNPADTEIMNDGTTGYGSVGYEYRIGKYEVTADQWAAVIGADPNVGNAGDWSGSQPTAGVKWYEAAKFCNWLTSGHYNQGYYTILSDGTIVPHELDHAEYAAEYAAEYGTVYFIPTEDEWYKAAYYDPKKNRVGGYWDYPTRHDDPDEPVGITSEAGTLDAVFVDEFNQRYPNSVENAGTASAYGTVGQGGNVWEWNEDPVPSMGENPGVRGGVLGNWC